MLDDLVVEDRPRVGLTTVSYIYISVRPRAGMVHRSCVRECTRRVSRDRTTFFAAMLATLLCDPSAIPLRLGQIYRILSRGWLPTI